MVAEPHPPTPRRIALAQVLRQPSSHRSAAPPSAPEHAHGQAVLLDSHARIIRDLRLSITDRCNFRCTYCLEPGARFLEARQLLATHELVRLARITCELGIRKVRLTGGEPTIHPDLSEIIAGIRGESDVELALITNGSTITRQKARAWKAAGLDRITISLDSLDPARFAAITRSSASPQGVREAIRICIDEGLTPLKVNAVLMKGINDVDTLELAELARQLAVHVRFIEFMPLDSALAWNSDRLVPSATTKALIQTRFGLRPCDDTPSDSTSRNFKFADSAPGTIGFISPVTSPFCGACSRLRITADGMVRPCLFSRTEWDLRGLLRTGESDGAIKRFLIDAAWTKQAGHDISRESFTRAGRTMSAIGG